ncbi:MAG: VOC family protein [Nanoarchaeota archaeon]|nr:VOC family protein [Nanoarchaeota archaeon]
MSKQKIIPHLWFDKEAVEAAEFYTSVFDNSKITHKSRIYDTPSGDCDIVGFTILDYDFMAISAGPLFKFNPSISFTISCDSVEEVNELWEKLTLGGKILMEVSEYPFSPRYGWIQDKYGVSWQIILFEKGKPEEKIIPHIMFVEDVCGKAEEAMNFYVSVFPDSKIGDISRYKNQSPDKDGTVAHSFFTLRWQLFGAMDSAHEHKFKFNEAISFIVNCKDQEEIDYYWEKLSAVPEAEQCGWIKDKFGVSWQIIPENMGELMSKNPDKTTPVMLKMKKIIIEDLEKEGEEK